MAETWAQQWSRLERPRAVTLEAAAELLDAPLAIVRMVAARVEPYQHQDGTPRWSLKELERALRPDVDAPRRRRRRRPARAG